MSKLVHEITSPLPDEEQATRRVSVIERIEAALSAASPEPDRLALIRPVLEMFVLRRAQPMALRSMGDTDFKNLGSPVEAASVYWGEIDHVAECVRRFVFGLVSDRICAVARSLDDHVTCAMHLRQFIEIVHWQAFYQYGQTLAFNVLTKESGLDDAMVMCEDLENFVRGAVTIDSERVNAARGAVGLPRDFEAIDVQVEEIAASTAKQFALVTYMANRLEQEGEGGIAAHVLRLQDAYRVCCGLVHLTPMLLFAQTSENQTRAAAEMRFTAAASVFSGLLLLLRTAFRDEQRDVRFHPIFGRISNRPARVVSVPIPELAMMSKKNAAITFEVAGGAKIVVYDPNARKRRPGGK